MSKKTNSNIAKLKNVIAKINEAAGNKVIEFASDNVDKFGYRNTPFPDLDKLIRGIPDGRFTIIAGASQVGKSALCLQIIAHLQTKDPDFIATWIDFENSWDPDWAQTLGVDLERIVILSYDDKAENMEAVLDKFIELLDSKLIGFAVIDSIGGMMPKRDAVEGKGKKEKQRSLEKANMLNLQTKLGEIFRILNIKIAPRGDHKGTAVVMLGHVYQVPNDQGYTIFAVRGGNAVAHWAHIRLMMKRGPRADWPKEVEITGLDGKNRKVYPGFASRIQLEKTKTNANEGQEIVLGFYHGRGFDFVQSTISAALGLNIIDRTGGWYKCELFPDGKVQGREAVDTFFAEDVKSYTKLASMVDQSAAEAQPQEEDDESEHK